MWIWWAHCSTILLNIFLPSLIAHPNEMEAVPLSDMSAAACAKALTFTWIAHFGVPKMITSDCGLQFTSNL
jgi:hypothetical protein